MTTLFSPQQEAKNFSTKNLATIISRGPDDHPFAICILRDRGDEQAIIFSPGDNSYDVKENVGKDIIHTGVRPAIKGARKWICDGMLLRLTPEKIAKHIITPDQRVESDTFTKQSNAFDGEKCSDQFIESKQPSKASITITGFRVDYLDKVATAQGYSGRLARTSALKDVLGFCDAHNILIND